MIKIFECFCALIIAFSVSSKITNINYHPLRMNSISIEIQISSLNGLIQNRLNTISKVALLKDLSATQLLEKLTLLKNDIEKKELEIIKLLRKNNQEKKLVIDQWRLVRDRIDLLQSIQSDVLTSKIWPMDAEKIYHKIAEFISIYEAISSKILTIDDEIIEPNNILNWENGITSLIKKFFEKAYDWNFNSNTKIAEVEATLSKKIKENIGAKYFNTIVMEIKDKSLLKPTLGENNIVNGKISLAIEIMGINLLENLIVNLDLINIQLSIEKLVNKVRAYLEQFNENNPFDLDGMSSAKTWNDLFDKFENKLFLEIGFHKEVKLAMKGGGALLTDKIGIGNFVPQIEGDAWISKDKLWQRVAFYIGDEDFEGTRVYFKNIKMVDDHLAYNVKRYLEQFQRKAFHLDGITVDMTWKDALNKLKDSLQLDFDIDFNRIKNLDINDKNMKIGDDSFYSAKYISFNVGNKLVYNVKIFFKNIKMSDDYLFNKVVKFLQYYNDNENTYFNLRGMSSHKKWKDVLEKVKERLKNAFGNEFYRIKDLDIGSKDKEIGDKNLKNANNWQNIYFTVGNKSLVIKVYFRNICNIPQMFCTIKKNFKKGRV